MSKSVSFQVVGKIVGKGRPRFCRQGAGVRTYTPARTAEYEELIKREYISQCNGYKFEDVPLRVAIHAYKAVPKGTSKGKRSDMLERKIRPCIKPDTDNVIKIVLDALNGIAYKDDKCVVAVSASKYYADEEFMDVEIADLSR